MQIQKDPSWAPVFYFIIIFFFTIFQQVRINLNWKAQFYLLNSPKTFDLLTNTIL